MRRSRFPGAILLGGGLALGLALSAMPQERPESARPLPGESAPYIQLGRRVVPGENDPYFLQALSLDALGERLEKSEDGEERTRLVYSLLVWNVHSVVSLEDPETRRRIYWEAERLFLALLSQNARRPTPDRALESDALFFIGTAWAAWKGSLDPVARERLERCSSLKAGHYRLAAELLVEKTAAAPGLDAVLSRIRTGDDAGALSRLHQAAEKAPADASLRYWTGIVLYRLGRLEEAIASFGSCLALDPRNPDALEARAACHWARKEWREAAADWEAVLTISPEARGRLEPYLEKAREAAK